MTGFLRYGFSPALLVQLAAELSWMFVAAMFALRLSGSVTSLGPPVVAALLFAVLMLAVNVTLGLYRRSERLSSGTYLVRAALAPAVVLVFAWAGAFMFPHAALLGEDLGFAIIMGFGGALLVRHIVVQPLVRTLLPHRVLVMGTGPEARVVDASLAAADVPGIQLVGFYPLERIQESVIPQQRILAKEGPLEDTIRRLGVQEIIVAVRQQRGGVLPLRSLLEARLNGVQVTDLARFFERVHGQVPIDTLKASWLIYGDGFRQGAVRTLVKRSFDVCVAALLLLLTLPITVVVALLIHLEGAGPVVYRQQRVGFRGAPFTMLKFRSMAQDAEKDGRASWAAPNDARVTRIGRFLRRTRADELPQLLNVLKGEMSFVGPRPERPEFVTMLTEQIPFYGVRHSVKPGITGWAQVRYTYGATIEQSVKKLEYDLYYVKNHSLLLDVVILLETARVVLLGEGAR